MGIVVGITSWTSEDVQTQLRNSNIPEDVLSLFKDFNGAELSLLSTEFMITHLNVAAVVAVKVQAIIKREIEKEETSRKLKPRVMCNLIIFKVSGKVPMICMIVQNPRQSRCLFQLLIRLRTTLRRRSFLGR